MTGFLERLDVGRIEAALRHALELDPDDKVTIDASSEARTYDGMPTYVTQKQEIDGEETELEDYYELSDFDVKVYDWAGDTQTPTLRWRAWMLRELGTDYAVSMLLDGRKPSSLL